MIFRGKSKGEEVWAVGENKIIILDLRLEGVLEFPKIL